MSHARPEIHPHTEPALNPASLAALQSLSIGSSDEFLVKLLEMFKSQLDRSQLEVDRALAASDWRALKVSFHGLKGACVSVGANQLGDCCRQLETVCKLGSLEQFHTQYARFSVERERVIRELKLLQRVA